MVKMHDQYLSATNDRRMHLIMRQKQAVLNLANQEVIAQH